MAKGRTKQPGVSIATLDAARLAAGAVAVLAPIIGIGFGLYLALKRTLVYSARFEYRGTYFRDDFAWQHSTLALGVVVIAFGVLLGAAAAALAVSIHGEVAPRLHAERLAAMREIADEPF